MEKIQYCYKWSSYVSSLGLVIAYTFMACSIFLTKYLLKEVLPQLKI